MVNLVNKNLSNHHTGYWTRTILSQSTIPELQIQLWTASISSQIVEIWNTPDGNEKSWRSDMNHSTQEDSTNQTCSSATNNNIYEMNFHKYCTSYNRNGWQKSTIFTILSAIISKNTIPTTSKHTQGQRFKLQTDTNRINWLSLYKIRGLLPLFPVNALPIGTYATAGQVLIHIVHVTMLYYPVQGLRIHLNRDTHVTAHSNSSTAMYTPTMNIKGDMAYAADVNLLIEDEFLKVAKHC